MTQTNNLPQRDNDIYKEIESFEKYELTTSVVYELAIRNSHVKSLLRKHKYCHQLWEDYPYLTHNTSSLYLYLEDYEDLNYIYLTDEEFEKYLKNLINEKKHKTFSRDKVNDLHRNTNLSISSESYDEDIKKYLFGENCEDYDMKSEINSDDLLHLIYQIEEKLLQDYLIIAHDYYKGYMGADEKYDYYDINEDENIENNHHCPTYVDFKNLHKAVKKGFTVLQEADESNSNQYYINHIIPEYKRKIHSSKKINALLDFSLPTVEIQAYIQHIKQEYDRDNEMIKSHDELTGNIAKEHEKHSSSAKKWADEFYIYDYFKSIKDNTRKKNIDIQTDIQIALSEYHNKPHNDYLDIKSIDNKFKKMTRLIEKLEYKNFIQ